MVIIVDLDKDCREGNRAQIHKTESAENTGSVSKLKSLKCDAELRNKNESVSCR